MTTKELEYPKELKYSKEHEWVKKESEDTVLVGITDYAQNALGDIVFVELPEKGKRVEQFKELAVVESNKRSSDVYAPVSGVVVEVNGGLSDSPELVNESPYEKGWIAKIKIQDKKELDRLLSSSDYVKLVGDSEK